MRQMFRHATAAAILGLGLAALGRPFRLYDGSWAEWGAPDGGTVVTEA